MGEAEVRPRLHRSQQAAAKQGAIADFLARCIDAAAPVPFAARQRRFDLEAVRGIEHALLAAQFGLQRHLPARAFQLAGIVEHHQLAGDAVMKFQRQGGAQGAQLVAAEKCQLQQFVRGALSAPAIAGRQELQQPAPLRPIRLRTQCQRRGAGKQVVRPLAPDRGIGQRRHVRIAELGAVAEAGAAAGVRQRIHQRDSMAGFQQPPGRGHADHAGAQDTDMHGSDSRGWSGAHFRPWIGHRWHALVRRYFDIIEGARRLWLPAAARSGLKWRPKQARQPLARDGDIDGGRKVRTP